MFESAHEEVGMESPERNPAHLARCNELAEIRFHEIDYLIHWYRIGYRVYPYHFVSMKFRGMSN